MGRRPASSALRTRLAAVPGRRLEPPPALGARGHWLGCRVRRRGGVHQGPGWADLARVTQNLGAALSAGSLAAKRVDAFVRDDGHHRDGRDGIGPPPAKRRVEKKSTQKDRGQVTAELRLVRFGSEGTTTYAERNASLRTREQRHHEERERRQGDSDRALIRSFAQSKRANGILRDIQRETEEAQSDDALCDPLYAFSCGRRRVSIQPPQRGRARGELDETVVAEANECDTAGGQAGRNRDYAFDTVVGDRGVIQPKSATDGLYLVDAHLADDITA